MTELWWVDVEVGIDGTLMGGGEGEGGLVVGGRGVEVCVVVLRVCV